MSKPFDRLRANGSSFTLSNEQPVLKDSQINLEIKLATALSKIVVVKGRKNSRPKSVKRRSPGSRPKPSFLNHGVKALITISAINTTMSQRYMGQVFLRLGITACACGRPG